MVARCGPEIIWDPFRFGIYEGIHMSKALEVSNNNAFNKLGNKVEDVLSHNKSTLDES